MVLLVTAFVCVLFVYSEKAGVGVCGGVVTREKLKNTGGSSVVPLWHRCLPLCPLNFILNGGGGPLRFEQVCILVQEMAKYSTSHGGPQQ